MPSIAFPTSDGGLARYAPFPFHLSICPFADISWGFSDDSNPILALAELKFLLFQPLLVPGTDYLLADLCESDNQLG